MRGVILGMLLALFSQSVFAEELRLVSSWKVSDEYLFRVERSKLQRGEDGIEHSLKCEMDIRARVVAVDDVGSILRWEHLGEWQFSGDALDMLASPADAIVEEFRRLSKDLDFEIQVDSEGRPYSLRNEEAILLTLAPGLEAAAASMSETIPPVAQIELLQGLFRDYVTPELVLESTFEIAQLLYGYLGQDYRVGEDQVYVDRSAKTWDGQPLPMQVSRRLVAAGDDLWSLELGRSIDPGYLRSLMVPLTEVLRGEEGATARSESMSAYSIERFSGLPQSLEHSREISDGPSSRRLQIKIRRQGQ